MQFILRPLTGEGGWHEYNHNSFAKVSLQIFFSSLQREESADDHGLVMAVRTC
ncbi:hypothetical protein [Candidatus Xiphinematobacter sp. Idaho Grape]|uniref:hypothetical protein n=1 Tax=Candidatus Xiphinematobacter sp. Idaho Grape TaxID=1704307 RepID=UPI00130DE4F2|nr:hypothetical protein [Candidatus Xiphinematobacter sp. Idaho Grape]